MIKKIQAILFFSLAASGLQAQNAVPAYQKRVELVSEKNIVANLKEFGGVHKIICLQPVN